MIISLSGYYYTNKFIPISTDSTILKVAKVSGLIFLGYVAFFIDCTLKLLAYRNITQEKKLPNLSNLIKNTLDSTEIQDTPIVEQIPRDKHSESLALQEKALETDLSFPIENTPASTEALDVPIVIEQVFDKYSMSLVVQKKTLTKYLNETFQITPEDFLQELKLFVTAEPISFKFIPVFAKGPLPIHERLVKIIEALLKKHSNNALSKDYEEYTRTLRDAIDTKEYKNNAYVKLSFILQELCFAKFVSTVLTGLQEKTLENMPKFHSPRNMTNISEQIKEDNKVLWKQPKREVRQSVLLNWEKLCNSTGLNSDQLCSANIPELRSIHKVKQNSEEHSIYYIRYPTPTIQLLGSAAIAPEFIGFLDYIQKEGSSFLHVNHQYMDKESKNPAHVADNNRAKAIQRLEDTHTEAFHFLSLPFDGPIIKEIDAKNLAKWKKSLVDALIKEKRGFKLPKKFRKSAASKKKEIKQLLNKLQSLYFFGKPEFNETERRVLLVIFYSYLKDYFKSEYQIRIMASVCKDNKDRGNVSACIDEALFNLRLGRENDPKALKDLHLRILSPFIFRNEGIVPHRLKFLTDLLDHIARLDDTQKKSIREFQINEQYQIVDQWIPRSNEGVRV